jgi:hypothetical protein
MILQIFKIQIYNYIIKIRKYKKIKIYYLKTININMMSGTRIMTMMDFSANKNQ